MSDGGTAAAKPDTSGPAPLHGLPLIAMGVLLGMANFLAAFDLSIANVSIPNIAAGLAVSPRDGTWAITSYMVAEAITVPLTGWLAARFGPGRVLSYAMIGFAIASALCGISTSLDMLIAFRVLQGLAGGPMIPLSQSLLLHIFPKEKAGTAMGIWAMTAVVGPITGPIVGGIICDHWTWPWIFLISVPVGAVMAMFCWYTLIPRDPPPVRRPVDTPGLLLMILWIGAVQVILDQGQEKDWFGSSYIVVLTVIAIVGFLAFLIWELTDEHPIVNLRIFNNRGYTLGVLVVCIGFGVFLGSVVISPLWMQTNMGYTPTWAGLASAPGGMMMFTLSPLVAWLSARLDPRILISGGLLLFASIMLWRAHFASNVTMEMIVYYQLLNGASVALFFAPSMAITLGFLKPQEIADGAGMLAFIRTTAVAFVTSVTTAYWQDSATRDRAGMIDRLHGTSALDQLHRAGFQGDQAIHYLDGIVQDQAVMFATNDTFFAFACAMIAGLAFVWLIPKTHRRRAPAAPTAH